ncbi:MAG TPA: hypothetical protein VEB64_15100 [Azospirillaceae bacterium]|nr:hypothetical protein [Azospirillaceae bacterium]
MSVMIDVDPQVVNEQIAMLRGSLSNRQLNARQRYLVVNLLNFLQALSKEPEQGMMRQ